MACPDWKEKGIGNLKKGIEFLKEYRWSSYLDYIGKKNFPSVIDRDFLMEYFKDEKEYENFINDWVVGDHKNLEKIENYTIDGG